MSKRNQITKYIKFYEVTIASTIVILMVILSAYFFLLPNLWHATFIYDQQKHVTEKLTVVRQKDSQLSNLDVDVYKNALLQLGKVLPESRDYVSFFTTFDSLEKSTGVQITKTDFQLGLLSTQSGRLSKPLNAPAYIIPITMEVAGTQQSLPLFFSQLQGLTGRLINILGVRWNIKQDEEEMHVVINGEAYFYPLPSQLGGVDVPLPKLTKQQEEFLITASELRSEDRTQDDDFSTIEVGIKSLF
ncbi:hypothetical protein HYW55_01830 [Candidatus Gottesmanbacteria bacterium]|nr:hypothetical protein [Candidatus Gottesmanbacteria bacterium]